MLDAAEADAAKPVDTDKPHALSTFGNVWTATEGLTELATEIDDGTTIEQQRDFWGARLAEEQERAKLAARAEIEATGRGQRKRKAVR